MLKVLDDVCAFSPRHSSLLKVLQDLKKAGFIVEQDGTVNQYVGINIEQSGSTIKMTQPTLITRILKALSLIIDFQIFLFVFKLDKLHSKMARLPADIHRDKMLIMICFICCMKVTLRILMGDPFRYNTR